MGALVVSFPVAWLGCNASPSGPRPFPPLYAFLEGAGGTMTVPDRS